MTPSREAIIEAATRALYQIHLDQWSDADEDEREDARELMRIVLAAVTPLILERAAKVVEDHMRRELVDCSEVAAALRALKEQP